MSTMNVPEKWRILSNVLVASFAFMVHLAGWHGISSLQSSINNSAALGTISLMTVYIFFVFANIFVNVAAIRLLGCKWTMVVAMAAVFPFFVAQIFPSFYTIVPSAALIGLSAGPLFNGISTYLSIAADTYCRLTRMPKNVVVTRFFALFFMLFNSAQIWGNLISSLVLSEEEESEEAAGLVEASCGAMFCPDTNTSHQSIKEPTSDSFLTLVVVYIGCTVFALSLMAWGADSLNRYNEDSRKINIRDTSFGELLLSTVKIMKEFRQSLLSPIAFWIGLQNAFITADFSESYVSCPWGVKNIGSVMICYGIFNTMSAIMMGSLATVIGRVLVVSGAAILHTSLLIVLQLWSPTASDTFMPFVVAALLGVSDGIWSVQISALAGLISPGREEAAYSNYRLWECLGFVVAYSYSAVLCTPAKLYVLQVILMLGFACYCTCEWLHGIAGDHFYSINS